MITDAAIKYFVMTDSNHAEVAASGEVDGTFIESLICRNWNIEYIKQQRLNKTIPMIWIVFCARTCDSDDQCVSIALILFGFNKKTTTHTASIAKSTWKTCEKMKMIRYIGMPWPSWSGLLNLQKIELSLLCKFVFGLDNIYALCTKEDAKNSCF